VFGKHTDYAGGRTIVAAAPRGFVFLAAPRRAPGVRVVDARTGDEVEAGAAGAVFGGWRHYVEVVVRRLSANFPGPPRGASIVFASDVPRASGMSSSSALVVGVATALARAWDLEASEEWQRNIRGLPDRATYFACVENGLSFGGLAGDAGVGTHGGSEDHAAMLLGRPGRVSAFSFVPLRALGEAPVPEGWRFVIAASGVRAAKTGAAQGAYNHLSEGVAVLLRLWNASQPPSASLGAALAGPQAADRLRERLRGARIPGWPAAALERRLDHFLREDARIPDALRAFQQADAAALAGLAEASQRDAERLLGNQVPETSALAGAARESGAFAASSFGAGFGGSVWALVASDEAAEFGTRWMARFRAGPAAQSRAISFVASAGPAVVEIGA
jgi:galactokinase